MVRQPLECGGLTPLFFGGPWPPGLSRAFRPLWSAAAGRRFSSAALGRRGFRGRFARFGVRRLDAAFPRRPSAAGASAGVSPALECGISYAAVDPSGAAEPGRPHCGAADGWACPARRVPQGRQGVWSAPHGDRPLSHRSAGNQSGEGIAALQSGRGRPQRRRIAASSRRTPKRARTPAEEKNSGVQPPHTKRLPPHARLRTSLGESRFEPRCAICYAGWRVKRSENPLYGDPGAP